MVYGARPYSRCRLLADLLRLPLGKADQDHSPSSPPQRLETMRELSSIVRRVGLVPVSGGTDKRTSGLGALARLTW
jgi:hypothetical protein